MNESQQRLSDITCAALEGGINYWATSVVIHGEWPEGAEYLSDVLVHGGSIDITAEDDDEVYNLTAANMWKGIRMATRHFNMSLNEFYETHDAGMADVAVQFAIFGELVYA